MQELDQLGSFGSFRNKLNPLVNIFLATTGLSDGNHSRVAKVFPGYLLDLG
jgi:hypothetical protein